MRTENETARIAGLHNKSSQPCAPLGPADKYIISLNFVLKNTFYEKIDAGFLNASMGMCGSLGTIGFQFRRNRAY